MSGSDVLDVDITQDPGVVTPPVEEVVEIPSEETPPSVDDTEVVVEDKTTPPAKKEPGSNKSNFKKLAKSNRTKDAKIAELEAKLAEKGDTPPDVEIEDDDSDELSYDKVDLLEFITDTEGAGPYKNQIKEALEEFPGISFEKALAFAKAQEPEESKSHTMFNTKSTETPKTKKIVDLTPEEAAKADLSTEQMDVWHKAQTGGEKNPFSK